MQPTQHTQADRERHSLPTRRQPRDLNQPQTPSERGGRKKKKKEEKTRGHRALALAAKLEHDPSPCRARCSHSDARQPCARASRRGPDVKASTIWAAPWSRSSIASSTRQPNPRRPAADVASRQGCGVRVYPITTRSRHAQSRGVGLVIPPSPRYRPGAYPNATVGPSPRMVTLRPPPWTRRRPNTRRFSPPLPKRFLPPAEKVGGS